MVVYRALTALLRVKMHHNAIRVLNFLAAAFSGVWVALATLLRFVRLAPEAFVQIVRLLVILHKRHA